MYPDYQNTLTDPYFFYQGQRYMDYVWDSVFNPSCRTRFPSLVHQVTLEHFNFKSLKATVGNKVSWQTRNLHLTYLHLSICESKSGYLDNRWRKFCPIILFGSDRSSINADLCSCVRLFGPSLSRAVNLHHSGSILQAISQE